MPDSLPALEIQRSQILRQIGDLGNLRPGSICAVPRRCGKPTCPCAKPNDSGHAPPTSPDPYRQGEDRGRVLCYPGRFP